MRAVTLAVVLALTGCRADDEAAAQVTPEVRLAFASVPWLTTLAGIYSKRLPDVGFRRVEPRGPTATLDDLEDGLVEGAFIQADQVYFAFTKGTATRPSPHRRLRALAVIHMSALHFVVPDGIHLRGLHDLKGKRIAVSPGTSAELMMPLFLAQLGIGSSDVQMEHLTVEQMGARLKEGSLDAAFISSAVPFETTEGVLAIQGTHLASVPQNEISQLRDKFSFLRPITIPAAIYNQKQEVETIGTEFLFVSREGLDEDVVYRMVATFFDSLAELSALRRPLRTINFDQAPRTPIPLHHGAARFYREHQLFN